MIDWMSLTMSASAAERLALDSRVATGGTGGSAGGAGGTDRGAGGSGGSDALVRCRAGGAASQMSMTYSSKSSDAARPVACLPGCDSTSPSSQPSESDTLGDRERPG